MGFAKLREWVGTVTGKGVRWGRDSVGRSAPAFMAASTTALPPLSCTAIGHPSSSSGSGCFCCKAGQLVAIVCLRPEPGGESAGCVRLQWLVLRAVCLLAFAMPCPLPSTFLPPFNFALFAPVHFHVRQDRHKLFQQFASCETVLLAAATRACSGGPCAGSLLTLFAFFSCRVHDPGPWCSVR